MVNSIIAGNTAAGLGQEIADVIDTVTTSVIGVPDGLTLGDILVPAGLANNGGPTQTIALAQVTGNPAIDTGTSAVCAAARGQRPRPAWPAPSAACDIGAYEIQPPLPDAAMTQPEPFGPWMVLAFALLLIGSLGPLGVVIRSEHRG